MSRTHFQLAPVALAAALALAANLAAPAAHAQTDARAPGAARQIQVAIAAQPLGAALNELARQAKLELIVAPGLVAGKTAPAVAGALTVPEALNRLLAGSGLTADVEASNVVVRRVVPDADAGADSTTLAPVTVRAQAERADGLPAPFAGGQVGRGGRVGMLGNKDLMDTPFSTSSYTAQMIEDQQASTVANVLRADPSVREIFPEAGPAEHFNVRGFYMPSQDFAWNGLFGLAPNNRSATEILERVEVFKGPGALLFGMSVGGTVGGVVNLVPKRAADEPITRLTTTYQSDATLGAHLDLGRRFGEKKEFGIRVNAVKSKGDTAVDDQTQNKGLGSVALDYRGERLRATLDAYSLSDRQADGMPVLTGFASSLIPAAPDPTLNALPGAYSSSRSKVFAGSLEFDLNDQWTAYASLGAKRQKGAGYLNNVLGSGAQPSGAFTAIAMNVKNFFDADAAEAGVRGQFRTGSVGHQIALSANVVQQASSAVANRAMWASNLYAPTPPTLAAEPPATPKTSDNTLSSFALADTLSFLDDKYLLTLGLRQQRVRTANYSAAGAVTTRYDESALTPALGLVAKPWAAPISLYANYIEGLSQGGSVSDSTAANYGEVFAPYKTKQVEMGVKWNTGTFLNTLSVFQISKPSLIKNATTNRYDPDGDQRNRGIEWTTAGEVTQGLRLLGGATYIKAVNTKTAGGLLDGKAATGVPKWLFNLGFDWDAPWVPGLSLNATALYTGSQYLDAANTQRLPSWTRLDLGARYSTQLAGRKVVFRGSVVNATNKRYWAGTWGGSASVGAPRTFKLSASVDF